MIGHRLYRSTATPHSDRWARLSLIMWSVITLWCLAGIVITTWAWILDSPPSWWNPPVNFVTIIIDVMFLRWAIQGIGYRRRQRKREAELREFFKLMANNNILIAEDGTITREARNGKDDRGTESGPEGRAGS